MKIFRKFLVCSLILIIFCGAVFLIGWTQFRVSPGSCGIVISKTGGVSARPVVPGQFSWHWEFLIPTNARLAVFPVTPYTAGKTVTGTLPSGEVYGKSFGGSPDFSYRFEFLVTESVPPASLAELVRSSAVSDAASLEKYMDGAAAAAAEAAAAYLLRRASESQGAESASLTARELLERTDVAAAFPGAELKSFSVSAADIPDYALYEKARALYLGGLPDPQPDTKGMSPAPKSPERDAVFPDGTAEKKKRAAELLDQIKSLLD